MENKGEAHCSAALKRPASRDPNDMAPRIPLPCTARSAKMKEEGFRVYGLETREDTGGCKLAVPQAGREKEIESPTYAAASCARACPLTDYALRTGEAPRSRTKTQAAYSPRTAGKSRNQ